MKLIKGTLAGGVTYFLLGWIIYGMLLMDMMAEYSNPAVLRAETDMVWWAMICGNLLFGALLTFVFLKGNVSGFSAGLSTGAVVALLVASAVDMMIFATSTMMSSPMGIVMDVVASGVIGGVSGGVIGWVLGMGGSKTA